MHQLPMREEQILFCVSVDSADGHSKCACCHWFGSVCSISNRQVLSSHQLTLPINPFAAISASNRAADFGKRAHDHTVIDCITEEMTSFRATLYIRIVSVLLFSFERAVSVSIFFFNFYLVFLEKLVNSRF